MEESTLTAEIVTTGTEILLGDIVDTNAAWIAQQLRETGINLYYKTTVGDNELRLRGVIRQAMERSDVIIVTGGLGPTVDDVTRQAIANASERPLILHEDALRMLQARFDRFGVNMTDNNRQQALIPDGAILIENPVGTAPGFIVELEASTIIAVPGVPREMMQLMNATVVPYLRRRTGGARVIRRRILRTFGVGESTVDALLGDLMRQANPSVGLAAHPGQVDVRIAASAATHARAETLLDEMEQAVRAVIGDYVYSVTPGEAYETVLVRHLEAAAITIAIVETNTGGLLAKRLSIADPTYDPVRRHLTVGQDTLPEALCFLGGTSTGVDSSRQQLATAAATAIHSESGATLGIALIGTAGEDEGVFGQVSGETWLGLATKAGVETVRIPFGGVDDYTTLRITNQVLSRLAKLVA